MLKNVIKKLKNLRCRRISLEQYLVLSLVVIVGLTLVCMKTLPVYRVSAPQQRADVHCPVARTDSAVGMKETTKLAIIQWMKEHSEMSEQVLSKIYNVAMNSVNADLVLAICVVESNFDPKVESDKGAIGLMGIMPDVWLDELKTHGIVRQLDDLYAISGNISSGIYVLGRYLERSNNLREALTGYSGGDPAYASRVLMRLGEISRVRRSEEVPRFAERG